MYRFSNVEAGCSARLRTRVGLAVVLSLFATLSSKAAELPGIFGGYAYGIHSQTNLAAVDAALDRVGWVGLTCIGTEGQTKLGSVAQLAAPGVLSAATVANTVFSKKTSISALARDVSTITGLTALGGLITADAVKAEAIANATSGAIALTGGGSGFTNLKVAGVPIQSTVAPNTKIPLPGFGTLTLRQTKTSGGGSQSFGGIRVEMLVVEVTKANPLGLPAGSKITVGTAASRFERAALPVNLGGEAFAARALGNASKSLRTRIGAVALISTGCRGTRGETLRSSSGGVDAGSNLTTSTATSTGVAGPSGGATVVRFASQVDNTSMLAGLIQAASIRAVAQDTVRNGVRTSSANATFSSLRINGQAMTNPLPNTRVGIPGFGYVVVNEQVIPSPTSRGPTEVNGLHVHITTSNSLGLPVGTQIITGHAKSIAFPVLGDGS